MPPSNLPSRLAWLDVVPRQPSADTARQLLRVLLLFLATLVPLNLPFSIPPVGVDGEIGWSVTRTTHNVAGLPRQDSQAPDTHLVVSRVARWARAAGVLPGDVLISIDGVTADSASLSARRSMLRSGDTLTLELFSRGKTHTVRLRTQRDTVGATSYTAYVIILAWVCWGVAIALLGWRGTSSLALVLATALLLIPPIAFSSGVPGDDALLTAVRTIWQYEAAAFRLFFPALLLHALALRSPSPHLRSSILWAGIYGMLACLLFAITSNGQYALAWAQTGWKRDMRFLVGFTMESMVAAASTAMLLRPRTTQPVPLRLLYGAIALTGFTAAVFSFTTLWLGRWAGDDLVSGINSLATCLLPVAATLHFFGPWQPDPSRWRRRRWTARMLSLALTVVHGLVIATAVAVVLNGWGADLGGLEWILFIAVIIATLLPAPALRWVREMIDRRLIARWISTEERAQELVYELSGELDPQRIARRVSQAIPGLLEVRSAELILAREALAGWWTPPAHVARAETPNIMPQGELTAHITSVPPTEGDSFFPVYGPERTVIAALCIGAPIDGGVFDTPARIVITTIGQGVSAALTAAKAYSDLRRAETELADAERVAAVGALAGGLAHEIKNPLASLKMGLYLLQRAGVDASRLSRFERDVGRIDDLVSGLLRVSNDRAEHDSLLGTPGELDLRDVAMSCVADLTPVAEDRNVTILELYPDTPIVLYGTPGQLRLVVLNLLSNAVESSPEGSTVTVSLTVTHGTVTILVRDEGAGIPPEIRERIFDLYFTTKRSGTGIGLALVRREAERLGGEVQVESCPEHGTQFRVTLPRAEVAATLP